MFCTSETFLWGVQMPDVLEPALARHLTATRDAAPLSEERRRPGRQTNVNPVLLPLLRSEGEAPCDEDGPQTHDLAPATGIFVGVGLSLFLWLALALGGFPAWSVLR